MQAVPRKGAYAPCSAALYAQPRYPPQRKKPGRFPGRALGHMGLAAQNLISLPFLRHCLNSATAVNSASEEELMAVSSES